MKTPRPRIKNTRGTRKAVVGKLPRAPRTLAQYDTLSEKVQEAVTKMQQVVTLLRSGRVSLKSAARQVNISPSAVKRLAGSVIRKAPNGRYVARPGDQLLRVLKVPTPEGIREIGVRGSRQASTLGSYSAALQKYLRTGKSEELKKFAGKTIRDDSGNVIPLMTALTELKKLGNGGVLSFESLYSRTA